MAAINFDTANTGYGGNYGGGGGYGYPMPYPICYDNGRDNGLTEAIVLAAVLGNGFNNHDDHGHDCHDKCCEKMIELSDHHNDHNHECDEIHDVQMEVCAAERQIGEGFADAARDTLEAKYALSGDIKDCCCELDRDILGTKFELSKEILNNRFETALLGKDLTREIDLQSCGINRNIDDVKFKQAIFAKEAQAQLDKCCCELKEVTTATSNETQKLMLKIDNKNDQKEADRERRALERKIDQLQADIRSKEQADVLIANSGTITDSLNTAIANLGSTLTTA